MDLLVASLCLSLIHGCADARDSVLEQIQARGEVVVATRAAPTTYFEGENGPAGLEYDLAREFARYIGVRLRIVTADDADAAVALVAGGRADLAAAGIGISRQRRQRVDFGPVYQTYSPVLIYRREGARPIRKVSRLSSPVQLLAPPDSALLEGLGRTGADLDRLQVSVASGQSAGDLLYRVWRRQVDYALAPSTEFQVLRRFYPELVAGPELAAPVQVAWALPRSADDSLHQAVVRFFRRATENGELERLVDRYFGHTEDFDYVDTRVFIRHLRGRLPQYRHEFEAAAAATGLDWRLLAAVGYQESHWNPVARSPTGVRGLMMLTRSTARQVGVENRLDPAASIRGGAEYLRLVRRKIPARIPDPDRTYMALAAYNIGFGHLEDARILTQRRGGDPDRWIDVRESLPLLEDETWYGQTRHGYARGREAVTYVDRIRHYYDLLVWRDQFQRTRTQTALLESGGDASPLL